MVKKKRFFIIAPLFLIFGISIFPQIDRTQDIKIALEETTKEFRDKIDIPFTAQAPLEGQWQDERYQNACEEASIIMAMSWVNDTPLTNEKASEEIAKIIDFQQEKYGEHRDTSAEDTARLIRDYYGYEGVEYKAHASLGDIVNELSKGSIVIAPFDGQKLNNPYYIPPGPVEHMMLIIGYDQEKDEFIVNDPGTKRGKNYRYSAQVVESALRDYPSGFHLPIEKIEKNIIIVKPPLF